MIVVRLIGGLGNQLFEYAAARRLALANGDELVIDDVSGFVRDKYGRQYQLDHFSIPCRKATPAERLEPFSRLRRYVKRRVNQHRSFERRTYIRQEGVDFDRRLLWIRPQGRVYLEGYWQSERYFKDVEETVRGDLIIKQPTDNANVAMAAKIRSVEAIAVHVRFFDWPSQAGLNNASTDYYIRAVREMELKIGRDAHYFIFSDRPEAARARIPLPEERVTFVVHNRGEMNAYADFWLMTQCRHFVIANSTFSWWGAWLASNPDRHVIAPGLVLKQGVSAWGFDGLIPEEWTIC